MQKWLSFIVPIYNAEKYLSECVESLLNQNFPMEMYEIILYDDNSTDSSLRIAKEYAEKYANVRAFTHPNAGVSYTRNEGLRKAEGEYVWFVDSDDYIFKDVLPVLYEWILKEKVDILIFDSVRFTGDKYWKLLDFIVKETPVISGVEAFLNFYYDPVPWNKLFRRAFLEKYQLYFAQRLSEDSEQGSRCFYHAKSVKAVSIDAIYYRVHETSLSHNKANQRALVDALLECLENHYKYMLEHIGTVFWMRACVLDIRRLHAIGLGRVVCTKEEKRAYLVREKEIVRKIVHYLPVSLSVDYVVLLLCAVSPTLILNLQSFLRNVKRLFFKTK